MWLKFLWFAYGAYEHQKNQKNMSHVWNGVYVFPQDMLVC